MHFESKVPDARRIIAPFGLGSSMPPPAVYARALSLIGSAKDFTTYAERLDIKDKTIAIVWILVGNSLIKIRGDGPKDWDEPGKPDPEEIEATVWPLSTITKVTTGGIIVKEDPLQSVEWAPQLQISAGDQHWAIPNLGVPDHHVHRGLLDAFALAVMDAIHGKG